MTVHGVANPFPGLIPTIRRGIIALLSSPQSSSRFLSSRLNQAVCPRERRGYMPSRYQRGSVFQRGKERVWYGKFREDVRTPAGIKRRQRLLRLGTRGELPTKNAARNKLAQFMSEEKPSAMDMSYQELATRWREVECPTKKASTMLHYDNALRMYVLPAFGSRKIASISREDIQRFLTKQAKTYSTSALRSMRTALGQTLGWAEDCGWIKNPCRRIKLPQQTGGRRVQRTVLTPQQIVAVSEKLAEPYATLILFLAATGLRIGEAMGVQWGDFDGNLLTVSRRVYGKDIGAVKSKRSLRRLPIAAAIFERLRRVKGSKWVFEFGAGTPINHGNALKRYVRPAAKSLGIEFGGWHDFRHTLTSNLRRAGVHPKVVSDILGHTKVNLAMDVYDRTDVSDFAAPLAAAAEQLVSSGINSRSAA